MTDQPSNQTSSSPQQLDPNSTPDQSTYIAVYNDKVIGYFDNQSDATDALSAYQMDNSTDINDVFGVWSANQL